MPERNPGAPVTGDPDELAAFIARGRRDYLRGQKMLIAARNAEERLRRRGHTPAPEISVQRVNLEQRLDTIAAQIRQAEAWLAACAAAAGGDPLTSPQAEQLLLAIKANDASLALFHAAPEEMTAMLNRLLTSLEGSFEVRIGLIATHMCESGPAGSPAE
jgi:hypothetical protein